MEIQVADLSLIYPADHTKPTTAGSYLELGVKKQKTQIRSFVFWENLRRANLLTVLSDL